MKNDSNIHSVATLAVMGIVFCGTVLASQLLQEKLERKRRKQDDIREMRQHYKLNRLRDRLSYTDLTINAPQRQTANSSSRQQLNRNTNSLNSVAAADEDAFDYNPKNSNWSHFETSNEDDVPDGTITPPEDASSSSSSEAFLWTKATEKRRRNQSMSPLVGGLDRVLSEPTVQNTNTWMGRLRKTVAGFTTDDTVIPDELRTPFYDRPGQEAATAGCDGRTRELPQAVAPQQRGSKSFIFPHLPPMRRSASTPEVAATMLMDDAGGNTTNRTTARAQYNARIMPNKVVMVRHGQSEGNLIELLYSTTPDNAMRLTKLGWEQALQTGQLLKQKVLATGEPIHFIVSPYVRTVETFHGLVSAWCDPKEFNHIRDRDKRLKAWYGRLLELGLTWHEDPRIREQDFGNYQVPEKIKQAKQERHRFGPFFYRFPHGESASDVFDRVSTFLDSLWRSFDMNRSRNYVLVTHGISIRVLLARYFRYSIDQFSLLANPKNCEMVILGHDGAGKLQLDGRCELKVEENEETGEKEVKGHAFHKRLRVLPKRFVHKLNVRVSYDDHIGPPQIVGFDTNVVEIQEALMDAGGDSSKIPPRSDTAVELHREQSLGR